MQRTVVRKADTDVLISNMKAIVFGAGISTLSLVDLGNIDNIAHVVDSDNQKWGKYCKVGGKFIRIERPEIIKKVSPSHYYICNFTKHYKDEIKKE